MPPLKAIPTKDRRNRLISLGLRLRDIVWGRKRGDILKQSVSLNNWIRMAEYWTKTGALTYTSILKEAHMMADDYAPLTEYEFCLERDMEIRAIFSKRIADYVKLRRERMGKMDPQRLFKKMVAEGKGTAEWNRKNLARDSILSSRCPICRTKSVHKRQRRFFSLPDCHGYGGTWEQYLDRNHMYYRRVGETDGR